MNAVTSSRGMVPIAKIGEPFEFAFAAFKPMTKVPRGHIALEATSHQPPMICRGEFAVVNPADRDLTDEGVYVIQWSEGGSLHIQVTQWKAFGKMDPYWWIRGPAGGLTDGPYKAEQLQPHIVGRVVGVLADEDGNHLTELWGPGAQRSEPQRVVTAEDLPDQYAMIAEGSCMVPVYPDKARLLFNQLTRAVAGDDVALWRKPEVQQAGQYQCLIKRLVTALPRTLPKHLAKDPAKPAPVVIVETMNPPRRFVVKTDQLMGVHKCEGLYDGPRWKPSAEELRAMAAEQRASRAPA